MEGGKSTQLVSGVGEAAFTLIPSYRLRVVGGPDEGKSFVSRGGCTRIGSEPHADFVLEDPTVSRFHCEIIASHDRPTLLRDLDSSNGTDVDGVRVFTAALHDGAVITLGRTTIRFERGDDPVKVPISDQQQFGFLVGASVEMRKAFAMLERAAASDVTVLLLGETGTGKEAAAESIHIEGARQDAPFVIVDCGAIPGDLLESELFGHEKGAFTGAVAARRGAFEEASGGTIFLDEIGELGPELQPKLLRVLERRQIKPVGGNSYVPVDVRVVAATNRDLRQQVNAGSFRSDLYYRLAVLEIELPPLRGRPEDLRPLVAHILEATGAAGTEATALLDSEQFRTQLEAHSWPGNVRELRNYIERSLAMREVQPIPQAFEAPTDTLVSVDVGLPLKEAREQWTRQFEQAYVTELLERHEQNVAAAARAAGVGRNYLYRLLWRYGLR